jgi:hypothetical protein
MFFSITCGLAILMLSSLAAWKNRKLLGWGLIGGFLFPTCVRCLLVESHVCSRCKASLLTEEWRLHNCLIWGILVGRMNHDRSLIPAHEGTV